MSRIPIIILFVLSFRATITQAEIHKFRFDYPGTRNHGVWRLTFDPAIRDEGNYHNAQCWSHNGRYTCYTHWVGDEGPGGKASAEVHVVDLMTGDDILVDKGYNPRWANHHNWLFYAHRTGDGTKATETGTQLIRYDMESGEKVVITHGLEWPSGLDATDTWIFGMQYFRETSPKSYKTVRVKNVPGSDYEVIPGPNQHLLIQVNPVHPVLMVRSHRGYQKDPVYHRARTLFDHDGSNWRTGLVWGEFGHAAWSGDGEWLLIGDHQTWARRWNEPFPSDVEVLAWEGGGDICPADRNGRFIISQDALVDTRSGDITPIIKSLSKIIYPMEGDYSTLHDTDPKGSPDGTKMHFHSTRGLDELLITMVKKYDPGQPEVIHVESTGGFPESGEIVCQNEVVGYEKKTATTFEGITRQKYDTRRVPGDFVIRTKHIMPLSAFVLSEEDKARSKPIPEIHNKGYTDDYPLLYQRYTDCYVTVTRLPFPPHLRIKGDTVELIPGENHFETRGYKIFRDGKPLSEELISPGSITSLPGAGDYTAVAVEWSGLESPHSLPLEIKAESPCTVLQDKPGDFSWTREIWRIDDKPVSAEGGAKAPRATKEVVHLIDGIIAREEWKAGERRSRVDLNEDHKPVRIQKFADGKLRKRVYQSPEGVLSSEEFFGDDGFKTEYIRYYMAGSRKGVEYSHWWYDKGKPVKKQKYFGGVYFDVTGKKE